MSEREREREREDKERMRVDVGEKGGEIEFKKTFAFFSNVDEGLVW